MKHARLGRAVLLAAGLIFYFQNCSQPYQLETIQNSSFAASSASDVILTSPAVTNDRNIRLHLNKEYAREVYVTATPDCADGSGTWETYSEDFVYTLLEKDGAYPISVKFRNYGKVETPCIPPASVTLDQTPPNIQIPMMPATFTDNPRVNLQINTSDNISGVQSVQCTLNGTPITPCEAINSRDLTTGSYTFAVVAKDVAGNTAQPVTAKWTVDLQAPSLTINTMPDAFTPQPTAAFSFAASDVGTMVSTQTCQLDSGAAVNCVSPVNYSGLTEGPHKFTVTITDQATNTTSRTYNWVVDSTRPTLSFSATPAGLVNTRDVTFAFTAMDNGSGLASVQCMLDSGAAASCASPRNLTNLVDGLHTFKVTATDRAGNSSSISSTFTVDATAPVITFSSRPDPKVYLTVPRANFQYTIADAQSGIAAGSVTCKLDNSSAAPCSATQINYNNLSEGSHTFALSASDVAGNAVTAAASFRVDTVAPTTPVMSNSPSVHARDISFAYSSTDATSGIMTYRCALNPSIAEKDCGTTQSYTDLVNGNYSFVVYAVDFAGNRSASLVYDFNVH